MSHSYTNQDIEEIWSDYNKYHVWLDIEKRWLKQAHPSAPSIDHIQLNSVDIRRIERIEQIRHHDVAAFVEFLIEASGVQLIHDGLTSSDVVDTALSIRIRDSMRVILSKLHELISVIHGIGLINNAEIMGRTHGQYAVAMPFQRKCGLWTRPLRELTKTAPVRYYGKLSGPVGADNSYSEEIVLNELGLKLWTPASQVIDRAHYAGFILWSATVMSSLARISRDVWEMCKSEVSEAQEGFSDAQVGSSSMPTKRNPISYEQIWGLARVVRGHAAAALENIELLQERDISNSCVERIIYPATFNITAYSVDKLISALKGTKWNTDIMQQRVDSHVSSADVLNRAVAAGEARIEAHARISNTLPG